VVGIVEDGKYFNIAEPRRRAMFVPILQSPTLGYWLVVRSDRDPQQLTAALESARRNLDEGLPFRIQSWTNNSKPTCFLHAWQRWRLAFLA